MYAIGAYVAVGHPAAAIATAGAVVLLRHLKQPMHRAIGALDERDMTAIMQFALVTFVILPVLPDRVYGPYDVPNPRQIWWMVVLIVSINLAGYVAYKQFGARGGTLLAGVLGGLISSTATTAERGRLEPLTTWRLILAAALANLVFKRACAFALGSAALRGRMPAIQQRDWPVRLTSVRRCSSMEMAA